MRDVRKQHVAVFSGSSHISEIFLYDVSSKFNKLQSHGGITEETWVLNGQMFTTKQIMLHCLFRSFNQSKE